MNIFDHSPHLKLEWDYEKNNEIGLNPYILTHASNKKAWWVCSKGHSWWASIDKRTNKRGCPICANKQILIGYNNLLYTHPNLKDEWDYDKNSEIGLNPNSLSYASRAKPWWKCSLGHVWQAFVYSRTSGAKCPYCTNQKILSGYNDLATVNPDLAGQLDDPDTKATEIGKFSHKKYWWKCSEGHRWYTSLVTRSQGYGCPYCTYQKILSGFNDLATLMPELVLELDDPAVDPSKIFRNSNMYAWWKCTLNHRWKAKIKERVAGSGCPICCKVLSSKAEHKLRESIINSGRFTYVSDTGAKLPLKWKKSNHVSLDIIAKYQSINLAIEYDGSFWHNGEKNFERDLDKTILLLDNGYTVVRVRENDLPFLPIDDDRVLQIEYSPTTDRLYSNVNEVVHTILLWVEKQV